VQRGYVAVSLDFLRESARGVCEAAHLHPLPKFACVAVLASITVSACHKPPPAGPSPTIAHPSGLVLTLPPTIGGRRVSVDQTPTGFAVNLDPPVARSATRALVTFNPAITTPAGAWPKTRTVRGVTIRYAIETFADRDVGSGGPEYELRAWEPAGRGHIAYVQRVQTEGEPDFSLIWAVIQGTHPPS
jgi:hypothetical protein